MAFINALRSSRPAQDLALAHCYITTSLHHNNITINCIQNFRIYILAILFIIHYLLFIIHLSLTCKIGHFCMHFLSTFQSALYSSFALFYFDFYFYCNFNIPINIQISNGIGSKCSKAVLRLHKLNFFLSFFPFRQL